MSVFENYPLTISMILILFVIGWTPCTAWKRNLAHKKASFTDQPTVTPEFRAASATEIEVTKKLTGS